MIVPRTFGAKTALALCGTAAILSGVALRAASPAGEEAFVPPSPLIARLTAEQYRASIADIFGADIEVSGRLAPDVRSGGLLAQGASLVSVTPAGSEHYEAMARAIAEQVTDENHYDRLIGCEPSAADSKGAHCATSVLTRIGRQAFRRPLSEMDLSRRVALTLEASERAGSFRQGLAAAIAGILTSPSFLFRIDHVVAGAGDARLDGWSKAARLSYFLWNSTPDQELLAAAERGDLDTDRGLAQQVDRLLASPRLKDGIRAFFADFLHLQELDDITKDAQIYPAFTASVVDAAREQTLRTLVDLLIDRGAGYDEVFTTRRVAMNRALSPLYGIPAPAGWSFREFGPDDPYAGLLTQISFLIQHSHPGRTSPTLRGKAVREILMCQAIPAPPANVNFTVVQDVDNPTLRTTRARLQAHLSDEECAACHLLTDPIGLSLEQFDSAGQFRTKEGGEVIDTSATLGGTAFSGAASLGRLLGKAPETTNCLVQSVYRYAAARALAPGEQSFVDGLGRAFVAQGRHLPALLRSIALSPSLYAVRGQTAQNIQTDRKGRS